MSLGEQSQPVHVHLTNPPIEDPWRTQGDYRDDQRRSRLLYRVAMASVIVAALGSLATAASAVAAWRALSSNPVKVECVVAPIAPQR
jgi:hypothetical protein